MKWEYFGTGLAFIGIGLTLMLALPPPGWPKMPPALVHIGIIFGIALTVLGIILTIFGIWPVLPHPKIPFFGMILGALILSGSAALFWIFPNIFNDAIINEPLKRLIAYSGTALKIANTGNTTVLHGYELRIDNVSGDTIRANVKFLNADIDGITVLQGVGIFRPTIIPQTQGAPFYIYLKQDYLIPAEAKIIIVEFEADYDTIPETGNRRSYRKIAYALNWAANGEPIAPLLTERIIDEWEK